MLFYAGFCMLNDRKKKLSKKFHCQNREKAQAFTVINKKYGTAR